MCVVLPHAQTFKGASVGLAVRPCDTILPCIVGKSPHLQKLGKSHMQTRASSGLDGMGVVATGPTASLAWPLPEKESEG